MWNWCNHNGGPQFLYPWRQLISTYVRDYFEIQKTPPTNNPELGNGPKIGDGPDLPLVLKHRIFKYLDIKDINKMKDFSHTFINYVQFHNLQLSKQINRYLDEIIIRPQRQQKNEH